MDGVEVRPFTGLLVDFARELGTGAVVKGLRAITDFEYELQQADLNYRLDPELESIFVMSSPEYGYLSSSVVRQIASFAGDVDQFVLRAWRVRFATISRRVRARGAAPSGCGTIPRWCWTI